MAIGWLTVLKIVPWADVIQNAPVVVDGAKKLWNAASRQPRQPAAAPQPTSTSPIAQLEGRIDALEATLADQHAQLLASSELIKALADQNAQLIGRIDAQRRKLMWLGVISGVAALAAASSLWLQWT
ncbi:MAG: hypothetical protein KIT60_22315 [Burkholderiaceae bacterium]|nr:hypothetical protein [Burkholderiaceae bacterium]